MHEQPRISGVARTGHHLHHRGSCPAHVLASDNGAGGPAIIFYMDAGGIRPAAIAMAERLAGAGYVVLLPDLFYRHGPFDPEELLKSDVRAVPGPFMATTGNAAAAKNSAAFLAYLDPCANVTGEKVGAIDFCMGGGMAIAAAPNDDSYPPAVTKTFESTLRQAGVRYSGITYPVAHGWIEPDFPVYDQEPAERGWRAMPAFLDRTLRQGAS